MLKWLALILVTSVLCWGESHSGRESEMGKVKSGRPVVETPAKLEQSGQEDALNDSDRKELEQLLRELDGIGAQSKNTGEQPLKENTTTPNL
jgi:hypothetical protein